MITAPVSGTRAHCLKSVIAVLAVVGVVIGTGFALRSITLNSLELKTKGNITLVSIMPEDNALPATILDAVLSRNIDFLDNQKDYLAYEMPVDYIMQGMIANTGTEHHLQKQHHTVGLILDWVLHPFEHLRRSPSAYMAQMYHVDPNVARRHHCPLGIDDPNMKCGDCDYRRIVFVKVGHSSPGHIVGKDVFAFDTTRVPSGFIDINRRTGKIISMQSVEAKTAWSDVPTPAI